MISCCCGTCATIYKLDSSYNTEWTRDFYFDWIDSAGPISGSPQSIPTNAAGVCDTDSNGNVYQVGAPSQPPSSATATPPASYTLRSWDSTGTLRWSWSDNPNGAMTSAGLIWNRVQPTTLTSVRIAANTVPGASTSQMVLVGTDGLGTGHGTKITALDTDGNVLWTTELSNVWTGYAPGTFGAGPTPATLFARVHSVGAKLSLWRVFSVANVSGTLSDSRWILILNKNGQTVYDSTLGVPYSSAGLTPTVTGIRSEYANASQWTGSRTLFTNYMGQGLAVLDADDTVYEASTVSTPSGSGFSYNIGIVTHYTGPGTGYGYGPSSGGVGYYIPAITTIDWSYSTPYLSTDGVGIPTAGNADIALDSGVLVGCQHTTIPTLGGFERRSKSGVHQLVRSDWMRKIYFSGSNGIAVDNGSLALVTGYSIYAANGDRWLIWQGDSGLAVLDARMTSDGGSVWAMKRSCTAYRVVPDLRDALPSCSSCSNSFVTSGALAWTQTSTPSSPCRSWALSDLTTMMNAINSWTNGGFTNSPYIAGANQAGYVAGDIVTNWINSSTVLGPLMVPIIVAAGQTFSMDCWEIIGSTAYCVYISAAGTSPTGFVYNLQSGSPCASCFASSSAEFLAAYGYPSSAGLTLNVECS